MKDKKETKMTLRKSNELSFTSETIDLIKQTVAVGATDTELKMFLYQSQKAGLDPLARQIYFLKRQVKNKRTGAWESKVSIQTSIDGFRVVAERSGTYAGQDEPKFEESTSYPKKCTVTVYRFDSKGVRYPASHGVAYWAEYCPSEGQDFMWKKMPHTMLSKVAEALALRKAFPQDLSGLYTTEEMEQSVVDKTPKAEEGVVETETEKLPEKPVETVTTEAEDIVEDAVNESIPTPEEHVCTLHTFQGNPIQLKNRGQGIWDHRSRLNEKFQYDKNGNWYWCQGKGWHLSANQ